MNAMKIKLFKKQSNFRRKVPHQQQQEKQRVNKSHHHRHHYGGGNELAEKFLQKFYQETKKEVKIPKKLFALLFFIKHLAADAVHELENSLNFFSGVLSCW